METPKQTWDTSSTSPAGCDTSRLYTTYTPEIPVMSFPSEQQRWWRLSLVFVFVSQISGTRGPVGTSNIQETSLPFDLSVFKSLLQIEVTVSLSMKYVLSVFMYQCDLLVDATRKALLALLISVTTFAKLEHLLKALLGFSLLPKINHWFCFCKFAGNTGRVKS